MTFRKTLCLISISFFVLCGFVTTRDEKYVSYFLHLWSAGLFRERNFTLHDAKAIFGKDHIHRVEMSLSCYKALPLESARKLLVSVALDFIDKVNSDPGLKEKGLLKEKFIPRQLHLRILCDNVIGETLDAIYVREIILDRGQVTYITFKNMPEVWGKSSTIHEEFEYSLMLTGNARPADEAIMESRIVPQMRAFPGDVSDRPVRAYEELIHPEKPEAPPKASGKAPKEEPRERALPPVLPKSVQVEEIYQLVTAPRQIEPAKIEPAKVEAPQAEVPVAVPPVTTPPAQVVPPQIQERLQPAAPEAVKVPPKEEGVTQPQVEAPKIETPKVEEKKPEAPAAPAQAEPAQVAPAAPAIPVPAEATQPAVPSATQPSPIRLERFKQAEEDGQMLLSKAAPTDAQEADFQKRHVPSMPEMAGQQVASQAETQQAKDPIDLLQIFDTLTTADEKPQVPAQQVEQAPKSANTEAATPAEKAPVAKAAPTLSDATAKEVLPQEVATKSATAQNVTAQDVTAQDEPQRFLSQQLAPIHAPQYTPQANVKEALLGQEALTQHFLSSPSGTEELPIADADDEETSPDDSTPTPDEDNLEMPEYEYGQQSPAPQEEAKAADGSPATVEQIVELQVEDEQKDDSAPNPSDDNFEMPEYEYGQQSPTPPSEAGAADQNPNASADIFEMSFSDTLHATQGNASEEVSKEANEANQPLEKGGSFITYEGQQDDQHRSVVKQLLSGEQLQQTEEQAANTFMQQPVSVLSANDALSFDAADTTQQLAANNEPELAPQAESTEEKTPEESKGFFSRLFGRSQPETVAVVESEQMADQPQEQNGTKVEKAAPAEILADAPQDSNEATQPEEQKGTSAETIADASQEGSDADQPVEQEKPKEEGFFSRFFGRSSQQTVASQEVAESEETPKQPEEEKGASPETIADASQEGSDVDQPVEQEKPKEEGFFSRLFGRSQQQEATSQEVAESEETPKQPEEEKGASPETIADASQEGSDVDQPVEQEKPKEEGFFSRLFGRSQQETPAVAVVENEQVPSQPEEQNDTKVEKAAPAEMLADASQEDGAANQPIEQEKPKEESFFSRLFGRSQQQEATSQEVAESEETSKQPEEEKGASAETIADASQEGSNADQPVEQEKPKEEGFFSRFFGRSQQQEATSQEITESEETPKQPEEEKGTSAETIADASQEDSNADQPVEQEKPKEEGFFSRFFGRSQQQEAISQEITESEETPKQPEEEKGTSAETIADASQEGSDADQPVEQEKPKEEGFFSRFFGRSPQQTAAPQEVVEVVENEEMPSQPDEEKGTSVEMVADASQESSDADQSVEQEKPKEESFFSRFFGRSSQQTAAPQEVVEVIENEEMPSQPEEEKDTSPETIADASQEGSDADQPVEQEKPKEEGFFSRFFSRSPQQTAAPQEVVEVAESQETPNQPEEHDKVRTEQVADSEPTAEQVEEPRGEEPKENELKEKGLFSSMFDATTTTPAAADEAIADASYENSDADQQSEQDKAKEESLFSRLFSSSDNEDTLLTDDHEVGDEPEQDDAADTQAMNLFFVPKEGALQAQDEIFTDDEGLLFAQQMQETVAMSRESQNTEQGDETAGLFFLSSDDQHDSQEEDSDSDEESVPTNQAALQQESAPAVTIEYEEISTEEALQSEADREDRRFADPVLSSLFNQPVTWVQTRPMNQETGTWGDDDTSDESDDSDEMIAIVEEETEEPTQNEQKPSEQEQDAQEPKASLLQRWFPGFFSQSNKEPAVSEVAQEVDADQMDVVESEDVSYTQK